MGKPAKDTARRRPSEIDLQKGDDPIGRHYPTLRQGSTSEVDRSPALRSGKRKPGGRSRVARRLHDFGRAGPEAALRDECDSFEQRSGISTQFTATNVPVRLPSEVALCLRRVAQESLRNVHKHSQSPYVKARLEGSRQGVTLRIEDGGDGFDLDAVLRKGGLGLISMEERVRLANGELTIQSSPDEETVVTAFIPLGKEPAATKAT